MKAINTCHLFLKLINDSKEKAMNPQFLDHFESSYKEAMKEQELLRNLEDALSARIKEIITPTRSSA
jgi:hypothetical protein